MALQKSFVTKQGFVCPEAYFVITNSLYRKGAPTSINLVIYKDKLAKDEKMQPLESITYNFNYDLSSPLNIITQAYDMIKQEPTMIGSLDV